MAGSTPRTVRGWESANRSFAHPRPPSDRWKDDLRALLGRAGLPDRVITAPDLGDDAENQARLRLLTEHRGYGTRTEIFDGDDLVVLEGHVRLTAFMLARGQLPPELQVLAGSSPAMTRWDCW